MYHLTTPVQGFFLALMIFVWLGCNHLGLDVALMNSLAGTEEASSDSEPDTARAPFAR